MPNNFDSVAQHVSFSFGMDGPLFSINFAIHTNITESVYFKQHDAPTVYP